MPFILNSSIVHPSSLWQYSCDFKSMCWFVNTWNFRQSNMNLSTHLTDQSLLPIDSLQGLFCLFFFLFVCFLPGVYWNFIVCPNFGQSFQVVFSQLIIIIWYFLLLFYSLIFFSPFIMKPCIKLTNPSSSSTSKSCIETLFNNNSILLAVNSLSLALESPHCVSALCCALEARFGKQFHAKSIRSTRKYCLCRFKKTAQLNISITLF